MGHRGVAARSSGVESASDADLGALGDRPDPGGDTGWVLVNSGIQDRAVPDPLTTMSDSLRAFIVEDVAVVTSLGMAAAPLATFSAVLQSATDGARTYFGVAPRARRHIAATREAYRLDGTG
jgi:hypothetical protein